MELRTREEERSKGTLVRWVLRVGDRELVQRWNWMRKGGVRQKVIEVKGKVFALKVVSLVPGSSISPLSYAAR